MRWEKRDNLPPYARTRRRHPTVFEAVLFTNRKISGITLSRITSARAVAKNVGQAFERDVGE